MAEKGKGAMPCSHTRPNMAGLELRSLIALKFLLHDWSLIEPRISFPSLGIEAWAIVCTNVCCQTSMWATLLLPAASVLISN